MFLRKTAKGEVKKMIGLDIFIIPAFIATVMIVFWIPICVYCTQKWSYKCYKELQKLNIELQQLGAGTRRGG